MKKYYYILFLSAKIFFIGCFSIWTLISFLMVQQVSYDYSVQDESYLLPSQAASPGFGRLEESKKPRYTGENHSQFSCSLKYLGNSEIHFAKPSGNILSILLNDIPGITDVSITTNYSRPPPDSFIG